MSTTGSMSSNPNDWIHFYTQNLNSSNPTPFTNGVHQVSEATVVTTTAGQFGSGNPSSGINNNNRDLSPDQGRVSKPARKRSRASRRTPTTLLNTDTSNFRAMVQQFTGGPATASFGGSTSYPVGSGFGFGLGSRPQSFLVQQPHGYHPLQSQQQQQFHQQLQNQQYMLSLNNNNGGGGDGFVQRMNTAAAGGGGGRMGPTSNGEDDGFSSGGIIRPMGSNSTNGNASSNSSFMF